MNIRPCEAKQEFFSHLYMTFEVTSLVALSRGLTDGQTDRQTIGAA